MAVDSYRPTSFESSSKNQNDSSFKNNFDKNSDAKGRGDQPQQRKNSNDNKSWSQNKKPSKTNYVEGDSDEHDSDSQVDPVNNMVEIFSLASGDEF